MNFNLIRSVVESASLNGALYKCMFTLDWILLLEQHLVLCSKRLQAVLEGVCLDEAESHASGAFVGDFKGV